MAKKKTEPKQKQALPGSEKKMDPQPISDDPEYRASGKLEGKVAIITGGDSGIGKATAILFAKEGAKLVLVYLEENEDAEDTRQLVNQYKGEALLIAGDISDNEFCQQVIKKTIAKYGQLDILVNNAAEQHVAEGLDKLKIEDLHRTFEVNIYSMFYLSKAALPHLKPGSCIINTTSITAYKGSPTLLDYSATKGAIVAFTRSLSGSLVEKGIRVNAVAPGPIWTPLIPATFDEERTSEHGASAPMKRPGQPVEVAPCYLFLASRDSSYMTGQVLHPNGGSVVNG